MAQSPPPTPVTVATQQQAEPEPPPHPWRSRPFALDAVLGVATPWGLAGLSAEFAPIEQLSLGGGAGTNLFGWQIAAMARARFTPARPNSLYAGAGYSQGRHHQAETTRDGALSVLTGPFSAMSHNSQHDRDWRIARWVNVELGVERREPRGLDVRGFVGGAFLLNPGDGVAAEPLGSDSSPVLAARGFMLYAGAALGFAL